LVEREARFVEAAKKAGVRHLVKFSAIGAHPAASSRSDASTDKRDTSSSRAE
jgi:hypothetical protein